MLRLTREFLKPDGYSEHKKHHRATAGGIQLPGVMGLSSTVKKNTACHLLQDTLATQQMGYYVEC